MERETRRFEGEEHKRTMKQYEKRNTVEHKSNNN